MVCDVIITLFTIMQHRWPTGMTCMSCNDYSLTTSAKEVMCLHLCDCLWAG